MTVEKSGRLGLSHDLAQGGPSRFASDGVKHLRYLGRAHRLGDRQSEYRNDRRIGYLAQELAAEGGNHVRESLTIAQRRKIGGHLKSSGAGANACDEYFVLVAHARTSISSPSGRSFGGAVAVINRLT